MFLVVSVSIGFLCYGLARDGLENYRLVVQRESWVRNEVRNPKSVGYESLDEEDEPIEISQRNPINMFKKEFSNIAQR